MPDADTKPEKPPAVWEAETRKLDAEALAAVELAALNKANAVKALAESEKLVAETRGADIAARYNEHVEAVAALDRQNREYDERKRRATDEYHHVYVFKESVSAASVANCEARLREWMRNDPECDIEINFNSPGGSVIDGMALWDFIQQVRARGHNVTTSTIGYAASMAGILLQAGDVRIMGAESWLMIHEISFGASGKIGEIEDTVEWVKKIQERVVKIFASRSTMTAAYIRKNWTRRDWWISSDEALKLGLIDKIR